MTKELRDRRNGSRDGVIALSGGRPRGVKGNESEE